MRERSGKESKRNARRWPLDTRRIYDSRKARRGKVICENKFREGEAGEGKSAVRARKK